MTRIGGIGAEIFGAAVVVREADQPQILEPVALRFGDRKQHAVRNRAVGLAVNGHRIPGLQMMAIVGDRGHRGPRLRPEAEIAVGADDALAECDRADMPLAHRAHRHDEAQLVAPEPALVGVQHDAGIHQCGGGIAIFVAEIGADQPALDRRNRARVQPQIFGDLGKAFVENAADLPVPLRKILPDEAEFEFGLILVEPQQILDELRRARRFRHARLPCEVERPQHDARGVRRQLLAKDSERCLVGSAIEHGRLRNPDLPPPGGPECFAARG